MVNMVLFENDGIVVDGVVVVLRCVVESEFASDTTSPLLLLIVVLLAEVELVEDFSVVEVSRAVVLELPEDFGITVISMSTMAHPSTSTRTVYT